MKKKISIVAVIILLILILSTLFQTNTTYAAVSYEQKNQQQFSFDENKRGFIGMEEDKTNSPFTFNKELLITEDKLRDMMVNQNFKLTLYTSFQDGEENRSRTVTITSANKTRVLFAGMSVSPIIYNNVIYAQVGYLENGDSYVGIIPLKVMKSASGKFTYNIHTTTPNNLPLFLTRITYFTSSDSTAQPVASPVVTKSNKLIYLANQVMVRYDLTSDGKLGYGMHKNVNVTGTVRDRIASLTYAETNDRVYSGSWNGTINRINPDNLAFGAMDLNNYAKDLTGQARELVSDARVVAAPTVVGNGSSKKLLFGIIKHNTPRNEAGGICSMPMDMSSLNCTIEADYYRFNSSRDVIGKSSIGTEARSGVDVGIDTNFAWSSKHNLAFGQDRTGNFYAVNADGLVKFKDRTFRGGMAFSNMALDEEQTYVYQKLDGLREGNNYDFYGSGVFSALNSINGRVIRWNADEIANKIRNNSDTVVESEYYANDISKPISSITLKTSDGILYSHVDWLSPTKITGSPTLMGDTLIVSNATHGSTTGGIIAMNMRYNSSGDVVNRSSRPISRPNANVTKPGILDFVKDEANKSYVHGPGMGFFASPSAGIHVSQSLEEAIVAVTGDGMIVLHLQNADMFPTDLSVKSTEQGGKYYTLLPGETGFTPYEGRIRVATSPVKDLYVPATTSLDTEIKVVLYHTVNALPSNTLDVFKCDDPEGTTPCYFPNGTNDYETVYERDKLIRDTTSGINDYNGAYRPLAVKGVKLRDIPDLKSVKDSSGITQKYMIPAGSLIVDDTFPVYRHASNMNDKNKSKHHIIVSVDASNIVEESDEMNNIGYRMIEYEGLPQPDLELSCQYEMPSSGEYDKNVTYNGKMYITNRSDMVEVKNRFDYRIRRNSTTIKSSYVEVNSFPDRQTLKPGDVIEVPFTYNFTTDGLHTIGIDVNLLQDSGLVPEESYLNNNCSTTFPVNVPMQPDLTAYSGDSSNQTYKVQVNGSGTIIRGTDVLVRGVVKNIGSGKVTQDNTSYMRITSPTGQRVTVFSPCEAVIRSQGTCNIGTQIPANQIRLGTYSITLKADYAFGSLSNNGIVAESSEFNNIDNWSFNVIPMDALPPANSFSPNNGGIKDNVNMTLPTSRLNISDYTIAYKIGIFNSNNQLVRTITQNSTSFRYPYASSSYNPHYVNGISSYQSSYLDSTNATASWNAVPKTSGEYVWDGKNDAGIVLPDDDYRIGIWYQYESPNSSHGTHLVSNGCSYIDHYDRVWYDSNNDGTNDSYYWDPHYYYYDCYLHQYPYPNCNNLSSSFPTSINFGEEANLDTRLSISNADFEDLSIRAGEHLILKDGLFTSLEASEVYMLVDRYARKPDGTFAYDKNGDRVPFVITRTESGEDLLNNNAMYSFSYVGDKVRIPLQPILNGNTIGSRANQMLSSIGDAGYRETLQGCSANPYCMNWRMAKNPSETRQDVFAVGPLVPDGEHTIRFVAITKEDTPNSPAYLDIVINVQDSIINHIRVKENSQD